MQLGAFSISLAVKDIAASKQFYAKLGFNEMGGGSGAKDWAILVNGTSVIGLFQGMFDKNILTFNPGWNQDATPFDPFDDIRAIQKSLEEQGIEFTTKTEGDSGPASFTLKDPDGNAILFDQHR